MEQQIMQPESCLFIVQSLGSNLVTWLQKDNEKCSLLISRYGVLEREMETGAAQCLEIFNLLCYNLSLWYYNEQKNKQNLKAILE